MVSGCEDGSDNTQRSIQQCVLADRETQQAHTDRGMPELLLKSPASPPQDYRCHQNRTCDRTYYDIGATGTCGGEGVNV